MEQPDPSQSDLARLIAKGVRAVAWAFRCLARRLIPRLLVATGILLIAITVTLYALWFGAMLWFVTGRFGIVKNSARKHQAELLVSFSSIVALLAYCATEGRPAANVAVIAVFAISGATVWLHRQVALTAIRGELSHPLRRADNRRDDR